MSEQNQRKKGKKIYYYFNRDFNGREMWALVDRLRLISKTPLCGYCANFSKCPKVLDRVKRPADRYLFIQEAWQTFALKNVKIHVTPEDMLSYYEAGLSKEELDQVHRADLYLVDDFAVLNCSHFRSDDDPKLALERSKEQGAYQKKYKIVFI